MVAAGRLDRRISIQTKTEPQSSSGAPRESWSTTVQRMWAAYMPVSGTETFAAPERVARRQIEFRVRYSSLTSALQANLHRIIYPALDDDEMSSPIAQSRVYDIQQILELGRHEALRIITQQRADVA